jgi:hypothetical protein
VRASLITWRTSSRLPPSASAGRIILPARWAGSPVLHISEEQRQRFVALYLATADEVGLPSDAPFREALRSHVEFGSKVAQQNSHASSDAELHPLREVPIWTWPDGEREK